MTNAQPVTTVHGNVRIVTHPMEEVLHRAETPGTHVGHTQKIEVFHGDVLAELVRREGTSGIDEKALRKQRD